MFTDYTFTIISTISELNEIADALNNRRIQWDRLASKLMICNREKCNCFSNEEMGFSLETKYDGVIEEVENLSRLFPTAIIKCEDKFEDPGFPVTVSWYLNGVDCYRKSEAGKKRENAYSSEAARFISMDINKSSGMLHQVELLPDGRFDFDGIKNAIRPNTRLVEIQRSKGYLTRPTLSVEAIGEAIAFVKSIRSDIICMVDNCYGEFVERVEPSDFGADMVVGSLIKNPGGGLAPIGGYIAGTNQCVENAAYRLTSPGLGKEVGASLGVMRSFYQGFFLAPTVTAAALKGAIYAANIYEALGFKVVPNGSEPRYDIIQAVEFGFPEGVIEFCKGIQAAAPVDSYVTPEPWAMPGYDSDVIMAAGAFVQGSSIELSADGPIKPPYAVYFQGGLTWEHAKLGILMSLQKLMESGAVDIKNSQL